ncbi:MAG: hypothetical protein NT166_03740 [Candidatus Aminicenantes bacterium]|nr:hypothetical protein [Candidatus Aminicenantes bacterium]
MKILIIQNHPEMAQAIARFLSFALNVNDVDFATLGPYEQKMTYKKAMKCDLILVDAFIAEESRGFQFAKAMGMNSLVVFYAGEIDLEAEGRFWLVLPYTYDRLVNKIKEIMANPAVGREEYEALEERFPELRERKRHYH